MSIGKINSTGGRQEKKLNLVPHFRTTISVGGGFGDLNIHLLKYAALGAASATEKLLELYPVLVYKSI